MEIWFDYNFNYFSSKLLQPGSVSKESETLIHAN